MIALALLLAAAPAPVDVRSWSADNLPAGATLAAAGAPGDATVRIANPGTAPLRVKLAEFPGTALTSPYWSIRGRVRTEGVVGQGFLEMWSTFPDGSAFFSRTLATGGPMENLEGTQAWRPFTLPFQSTPAFPAPARLTVNLVLPGAGTVELGSLELYLHGTADGAFGQEGGWLTARQAGTAGGIAGCILGLLGAAIGVLGSRGRGRAFVLGALATMVAVGVAALALAVAGYFTGQPREVWTTFGLLGVIATAVPLSAWRGVTARYREAELRRMSAIDA